MTLLAQLFYFAVSHVFGGVVSFVTLSKEGTQLCKGLLHFGGSVPQLWMALGSLAHIPTENLDAVVLRVLCQTL